jgi:glycosyltransferase involved in cell wall biosynthesis
MRVVITTPFFLPVLNGMTFATLQHAVMLRRRGYSVAIMAECAEGMRASVMAYLKNQGIDFFPAEISGSGLLTRPVVGDVDAVLRSLVTYRADVVVVEGRYSWAYHVVPKMKAIGLKVAFVSHGAAAVTAASTIQRLLKSVAYWYYYVLHERRIVGHLDSVAVLSAHEDSDRFCDAKIYRRFGLSPFIVPNTSIEYAARGLHKCADNGMGIRIAVIGEMSPLKNQLAAIKIFNPDDWVGVVNFYFPEENEYSLAVQQAASEKGLNKFRFIVGLDRERIINALSRVDLVVVFSKTEAQPLAIIDGLACGIPFVSTPVGCVPSMKGGLVCDIEGMAAVIRGLAENPTSLARLSSEAADYYDRFHSEDMVATALDSFVKHAVRRL